LKYISVNKERLYVVNIVSLRNVAGPFHTLALFLDYLRGSDKECSWTCSSFVTLLRLSAGFWEGISKKKKNKIKKIKVILSIFVLFCDRCLPQNYLIITSKCILHVQVRKCFFEIHSSWGEFCKLGRTENNK
jgi:hypothetical protein